MAEPLRRSLTFPSGLNTRIRKIQAQMLINEDKDISFNKVVVRLLDEALDHREHQEEIRMVATHLHPEALQDK